MNFLLVEDKTGLLQCTLFAEAFSRCGHLIYRAGAFLVEGKVEQDRRRGFSFVVDAISDLGQALSRYAGSERAPEPARVAYARPNRFGAGPGEDSRDRRTG